MSDWKRDCFGDAIMGAVTIDGVERCAVCGCAGVHGCSGADRRWQEELVAEVLRLQALTRAPSGETTTGGAEDGVMRAAEWLCSEHYPVLAERLLRTVRLRAQPAAPGPCRPGAWGSKGCVVHEGHELGEDGLCVEGRASGCPYPHPHPSHPCADRPSTCRVCGENRTLGDGLGRGVCRECWDAGKGRPSPSSAEESKLRPHTIPGWWQVWSSDLCMALIRPEELAPIIARTTNYVADTAESPHEVTFANGRVVRALADGSLDVGWSKSGDHRKPDSGGGDHG